jgi:hypothetical protein
VKLWTCVLVLPSLSYKIVEDEHVMADDRRQVIGCADAEQVQKGPLTCLQVTTIEVMLNLAELFFARPLNASLHSTLHIYGRIHNARLERSSGRIVGGLKVVLRLSGVYCS